MRLKSDEDNHWKTERFEELDYEIRDNENRSFGVLQSVIHQNEISSEHILNE